MHRGKTRALGSALLVSLAISSCGSPEQVNSPAANNADAARASSSTADARTASSSNARKTTSKLPAPVRKTAPLNDATENGVAAAPQAQTPAQSAPAPAPNTPAPPPPSGDIAVTECHKGDEFTCKVEYAIVQFTNEKRVGLPPLNHDKNLAFVSRDWSRQQSQVGAISHTGFPFARNAAYQAEFGTGTQINAENVAMFSGGGGSPEDIARRFVDMWYNSPGHRANMLGGYKRLGAGVYKGAFGYYGTQIFGN